ncbi:MAG: hypothetical protein KDK99_12005, partial [Verrucomicrobiales bacterium]|nr:hypothetical protein [Verrucomicrobiales bacterium]
MERVDNVRRVVSRIYAGANPLTVAEESVEGRWRLGLETGAFTRDQGLQWVRIAEQATGLDFLGQADDASVSDRALIEGISAIVTADVLGQRKTGKIAPGAVSKGLTAMARQGRELASEAGQLQAFVRSWRAFFRQVWQRARALAVARKEGKLGDDWQGFLDNLMGVDVQSQFDRQALQEAARMVEETGEVQTVAMEDGSTVDVAFSLGPLPSPLRFVDSGVKSGSLQGDEVRNPASIFQELTGNEAAPLRGGRGADVQKRRKSGGKLLGHSEFVAWARENGREIDPVAFGSVDAASFGGEHAVFYDEETGRVLKLTKPGLYGFQAEDAGEYLQRWALSNRLFGDAAAIEGITQLPGEDDFR